MNFKNRIEKLERKANPKDDIKIAARLWDEDKEPWPDSPEAKRKIEARRGGAKIIWIEREKL